MPKINVSITIYADVWLQAKKTIPNISRYINDVLKGYTNAAPTENVDVLKDKIVVLDNTITDANIKKSILEMQYKVLLEAEDERKRDMVRREEFKRWVCPVCLQKNLLDNDRCSGKCGLNTRNSPKTTYIYIDEVKT